MGVKDCFEHSLILQKSFFAKLFGCSKMNLSNKSKKLCRRYNFSLDKAVFFNYNKKVIYACDWASAPETAGTVNSDNFCRKSGIQKLLELFGKSRAAFLLGGSVMSVIIANIVSFAACTIMMLTGLMKNKKRILGIQCIQFILTGTSHFLLGGTGGVIATAVSLLRNLVFFKVKSSAVLKAGFIVLHVILSLGTITLNPLTWIPVFSTAIYTWVLDTDNIIKFKVVMMISLGMWAIYDAAHLNFISAAFDIFTVISNGYSIYQIKKVKTEE